LAVTIDATLARVGRRTFQISEQDVRHPGDLSVENITPATVKISLRRARGGTSGSHAGNG